MSKVDVKKNESKGLMTRRPFSDLRRMEREMERIFGDGPWGRFGFGWPRRSQLVDVPEIIEPVIDVYEEKGEVVVKAEIPGIEKEDLEINLSDNILTIKGEKKKEEEIKEEGYYCSERSFGSFSRTFEIPRDIVADKVSAQFNKGVLEIRLPKTEETKRKETKIKVK